MTRAEIKEWAKGKIKGHIWELLVPIAIASLLTTLTIGANYNTDTGEFTTGMSLGIFFYFVAVGLIKFVKAFNEDRTYNFMDLFSYANDYTRIFLVNLLQSIFVFLWALLLIVPGIIKAFAYALVPYILGDEKYKDLGYREVLKLSEDMMKGHKWSLFVFYLSYIGWYLLGIITLFIAFIYITPYEKVAEVKFLDQIKTNYEKEHK